MPYKIKTAPKKSALEPEELVGRTEVLADWLRTSWKGIAWAATALLAVALVWGGLFWFKAQQDERARQLEAEASKILSQDALEGEQRREAYEKASGIYRQIVAEYPGSSVSPFAQYQLGNLAAELAEYDRAVGAYKDFIERYPDHPVLLPMVYQRLGYAYLQSGDRQAALGAFEEVVRRPEAWSRDQAYYETGRLYEGMDRRDEAIRRYEALIKEHPRSPWVQEAQNRLTALGVFQEESSLPETAAEGTGSEAARPGDEEPSNTEVESSP